jgi:hypothetical protein
MLSREPYIYAAPRHLVIPYLTPEGRKLLHVRANGTSMQVPEYELLRISLPRTPVNSGKMEGLNLVLSVPQHLRQPPTSILRR